METKVCSHCKRELPIENFGIKKSAKDGHQTWCKECTSAQARIYNARKRDAASVNPVGKKTDSELSGFTARQLIAELKARGYEGVLRYTSVIDMSKI